MKKLEKEELLKVIGILAEAEGYDLLTMNKYGSSVAGRSCHRSVLGRRLVV